MEKLQRILAGETESHVMPFLWVHGEPHERYREQIDAMEEAGIREFCVEARPHPDFGGEGWWSDLAFLLEEAKGRGMGVWLLDDSHFPTGFANGEVQRNHPELRKRYLRLATFDVMGPGAGRELNLRFTAAEPGDEIIGVFGQRRSAADEPTVAATVDLGDAVSSRTDSLTGTPVLDWKGNPTGADYGECPVVKLDALVSGQWYVNVLYTSFGGGERETEGYLNPIDPAATQMLIDVVYEPLYQRFSEYFGSTFKGFFSDEPRFGNIHGSESASIGRNPAMVLPWRADLADRLAERLEGTSLAGLDSEGVLPYLPLLSVGDSDEAHVIRYAYMDLVSELYSECFDGVLSEWARAHGVGKIGHVIEDNNAAARLGYGPGHYFRSMAHSTMAGVDVVMEQLVPGYDDGYFRAFHKPGWEMAFFTYVLGKLGGSLAHLDPEKAGRCMAEIFGAYGWVEGNRLAKWLVDYMLARGVNFFVPHAYDAADFPDPDCPPHLAPWGHNPQTDNFGLLMTYTQRLSTLLSGGRYDAPVALWFNAEAEWSGAWQLLEKPARQLGRAQVEYDIVPTDYLKFTDIDPERRTFTCGGETFRTLVLPWSEAVPMAVLECATKLGRAGIPVWFVNGMPERVSEGVDATVALRHLEELSAVRSVDLEYLVDVLSAAGFRPLTPSVAVPWLRTYTYRQGDATVWFFANEHPERAIHCEMNGAPTGMTYVYDAFENRLVEDAGAFELDLAPYESKVVIVSQRTLDGAETVPERVTWSERVELANAELTLASYEDCCETWSEARQLEGRPVWVSELEGCESFCGKIRYRFKADLTPAQAGSPARLTLGGVSEGATILVNDRDCGTRIVPPYVFDLTGDLRSDENDIIVELDTTLGRAMDDFMGQYLPNEPTGLNRAVLWFGEY